MDLQRKEYPAMLENLQPNQAVIVLTERIKHVSNVNTSIAEWLRERRRVEEQYVLGLRRLAQSLSADTLDLGVFTSPWNKIISSIEAIAESHHTLATKIEVDVELPLRAFASTNREVQAMGNIGGNLAAMAKEIDSAQKKAEKLESRGGKASASKVSSAAGDIDSAKAAWDSQAPYVFEQLQAVDESRLNKLRDALTQLQTYEVDQVERNRTTAEQCLNVLLDVETADEIKTFSIRATSENHRPEPQRSRPQASSSVTSASLAPPLPPSTPEQRDDGSSHKGSIQEPKASSKPSGLKRFTTVLGRRRQSIHPYEKRGPSPEQKSSGNLASSLFGRKKDKETPQSPERQRSPTRQLSNLSESRAEEAQDGSSLPPIQRHDAGGTNGLGLQSDTVPLGSSSLPNGAVAVTSNPRLQEPLQPTSSTAGMPIDPSKDSEGFSVPPSGLDAISQAEQEAAGSSLADDAPAQQFKVDIRNAPIQEEDGDANAAIANVANTLRAQATPSRKTGTVRGRRAGDVRNTMFVPAGQTLQMNDSSGEASMVPSLSVPQPTTPTTIPIPTFPPMASSQPSPFKIAQRAPFLSEDPAGSDTQSIRSGRSLSSSASTTIRHPELHEPGLNSSVVETVSTWFERGQITKSMVIGQVALAYNPPDITSGPIGSDTIRLENFPVLEKVAPNPAFIEQQSDHPGIYTVDLAKISKTSVAFHYQVHLNSSNQSSFSPLLISSAWKPEPTQTSALLSYSLNPAFALPSGHSPITLSNLVLVLRLDPAAGRPSHAQSKPVGNFSKDRALIYWRLGDVSLARDAPAQQLRVRFFTDAEAKPGNVEARWEIDAGKAAGADGTFGSGLSVSSRVEEAVAGNEDDPFADEDAGDAAKERWKSVQGPRKIGSGTYIAAV